MALPRLAVVIPVYGHADYAAKAAVSVYSTCLGSSPQLVRPFVQVVDDATPGGDTLTVTDTLIDAIEGHQRGELEYSIYCHEENQGLLAAWNFGISLIVDDADYVAATNSDVLFTPGWERPLIHALELGEHLVGPVTNAPGTEEAQDVRQYMRDYQPTDAAEMLRHQAARLRGQFGNAVYPCGSLNGFFLMAKAETWKAYAYNLAKRQFFRPRNDVNSKGQKNPTPTITLGEYELSSRWRAAGLRIGFCPGSFVFHYRSITRGHRYAGSRAYRGGAACD